MTRPGRGTGRLQSIGPYTLLDRVGSGGMGVVYRALDRRSGTVVAFKLLHEHVSADPAAVERFRREAHVASLLRSSYAVHALDFGNEDGQYYFVSEFVDGRPLSEVLTEGRPDPLAALAIVSQVALALDEAESRQITHRDIKPDNILLSEDGSVKLADFGIAALRYFGGLTVAGSYVGTLAYSAPEQHRGDADIRSDMYSLGVVLFEMLAGRKPFDAPTPAALMALHAEAPPPLSALEGLPKSVVAVVARCLEKDPAARFQHASEFLAAIDSARPLLGSESSQAAALETFIAGVPAAATVTPVAEPPAPEEATREFPLAAAAALTAATPPEGAATAIAVPVAPSHDLPAEREGTAISGRLVFLAGLGGMLLLALVAAYLTFVRGIKDESGKNPAGSGASPTSVLTGQTTASPGATASSSVPASVTQVTPGLTTAATELPGIQPQPTATAVPPTPTAPPPTATTAPAPSYSAPVFATTRTDSGLPPAGAVPSGGTLGFCPIRELWAYVTHANVPVGTQMTGSWTFQGAFQANNPTFATDAVNGTTNYSFTNAQGLPQGTYGFTLRAGLTQVASGTVTIAC